MRRCIACHQWQVRAEIFHIGPPLSEVRSCILTLKQLNFNVILTIREIGFDVGFVRKNRTIMSFYVEKLEQQGV
jgi:hypothetical protein